MQTTQCRFYTHSTVVAWWRHGRAPTARSSKCYRGRFGIAPDTGLIDSARRCPADP